MIAQLKNAFVCDVIDDIWSFPTASQNASACQGLKMPRNVGLGKPRRLHEPGYVLLPLFQGQNQFQPARFAQNPKPRRNELKRVGRHALKFCFTSHRKRTTGFHFAVDYMRIYSYHQIITTILQT